MRPIVMTINGSDPTGQTGIAADLAVFRTHRLATQCVVTAVQGPSELYPLPTTVVGGELSVALREAAPAAVKLGVLGTGEVASTIAAYMRDRLRNVVLDPELDARLGHHQGVVAAILRLLPLATVVTPSVEEASALVGWPIVSTSDMASAAAQLASLGTPHIVITGGGLGGNECVDAVWTPTGTRFMRSPRIDAPNTRGAGCMFSAMITANLARGRGVMEAITLAKEHVTRALTAAAAHARDVAQATAWTPRLAPGHTAMDERSPAHAA